jgi:hypothetical protein
MRRLVILAALGVASCFVYGEDLLEDADDEGSSTTSTTTSSGVGGFGGGGGFGGSGGMASTTSSTTTSTTSSTTTSTTSATTTSAASTSSTSASTTSGMMAADVWINELHYDNASTDVNEGLEVAGPAGTDLASYSLELYNGATGAVYSSVPLSGIIPNQQAGFGVVWFPIVGIQNGDPDGLALVFGGTQVLQFLSYEGTFTATNGPASGMTSVDIGVFESTTSPVGESLQLVGTGSTYGNFSWNPTTLVATPDLPNQGQTFQ